MSRWVGRSVDDGSCCCRRAWRVFLGHGSERDWWRIQPQRRYRNRYPSLGPVDDLWAGNDPDRRSYGRLEVKRRRHRSSLEPER